MSPIQREYDWHFVVADPATLLFNAAGMVELLIENRAICLATTANTYVAFKPNVPMPAPHLKMVISMGKEMWFVPCTTTNFAFPMVETVPVKDMTCVFTQWNNGPMGSISGSENSL